MAREVHASGRGLCKGAVIVVSVSPLLDQAGYAEQEKGPAIQQRHPVFADGHHVLPARLPDIEDAFFRYLLPCPVPQRHADDMQTIAEAPLWRQRQLAVIDLEQSRCILTIQLDGNAVPIHRLDVRDRENRGRRSILRGGF